MGKGVQSGYMITRNIKKILFIEMFTNNSLINAFLPYFYQIIKSILSLIKLGSIHIFSLELKKKFHS